MPLPTLVNPVWYRKANCGKISMPMSKEKHTCNMRPMEGWSPLDEPITRRKDIPGVDVDDYGVVIDDYANIKKRTIEIAEPDYEAIKLLATIHGGDILTTVNGLVNIGCRTYRDHIDAYKREHDLLEIDCSGHKKMMSCDEAAARLEKFADELEKGAS